MYISFHPEVASISRKDREPSFAFPLLRSAMSSIHLKDHQAHVPLQAVVVADSFNERFMPLTHDRPRVSISVSSA